MCDDINMKSYVNQPFLLDNMFDKDKIELAKRTFLFPETPDFVSRLQYIKDEDILDSFIHERKYIWS